MPGPPPTPTEHLKARGSWRSKERDKTEPQDAVSAPSRPKFLSEEAKAEWDRIVPILLQRRTLSQADRGELAAMCMWWGEFADAYADLQELRKSGKAYKGHLIDHPRVRMKGASEQYHKYAAKFGLSPADKARVQVAPDEKPKQEKAERPILRIAL